MSRALLDRFYTAFAARDGATMAACYHPQAQFSDPAFPDLKGADPGRMWQMLTERGKDLVVEYKIESATESEGRVHWEARYTFSATGRKVHNVITGEFEFKDGLIYRHRDNFDFWRWSRQALGPMGLLLGWSPMLRKKVQGKAAQGLAAYRK